MRYEGMGIMDYVTDLGDQLSLNALSAQENNSDTTWTKTKKYPQQALLHKRTSKDEFPKIQLGCLLL